MAGRKNKHAYLDDFEKDLNGNYQYRGALYRYAGTPSRGRALTVLWLCCGGGAALAVGAGVLPGVGCGVLLGLSSCGVSSGMRASFITTV